MSSNFVLRDIGLDAMPYSLQRRGAAPAMAAERPFTAPAIQTLESQLSDKYLEGFAAGRAAEAEAALTQRRLADENALKDRRDQAVQEGHAEGLAQGHEEARDGAQSGQVELQRQATVLQALADSLSSQIDAALQQGEDDLVGLCHDVICRILGEAAPTPLGVRSVVAQALELARGKVLSIHLHPDDLALYQAHGGQQDSGIRWVGDSAMTLGGVRIGADRSSLDATFDRQLQMLASALLAARSASKNGKPSP